MTNLMTTTTDTLTMSSREIAELVEARHDNVKVTIKRLADRGVIVRPALQDEPTTDALGRARVTAVYMIGKRDSYVVVAQLSPEFTGRLVDRWQELEAQVAQPLAFEVPTTFSGALRLAADQADQIEQQQRLIEEARPAVEFVNGYVEADGDRGFLEVAKLLGAKPNEFRAFLVERDIMYRLGGRWMPYQPHLNAGRFVVKTGVAKHGYTYTTARFTPKGVYWIAGLWAQAGLGEGGAKKALDDRYKSLVRWNHQSRGQAARTAAKKRGT